MSLAYGLKGWRDLFKKLERDGELLEQEVNSDRFFNFVVTAYHLCEWVEKDPHVAGTVKNDVKIVRKNKHIAACRDIANASKHVQLGSDHKNQVAGEAESSQAYGSSRYGKGFYAKGQEGITVMLLDNSVITALSLKDEVLNVWRHFLRGHSLIG